VCAPGRAPGRCRAQGVTYDTDVELVKRLIKRIGQEMLEAPNSAPA
jgi:hypothetical protein